MSSLNKILLLIYFISLIPSILYEIKHELAHFSTHAFLVGLVRYLAISVENDDFEHPHHLAKC